MKLSERLYDNLVTKVNFKLSKVNNINTTGFILKTKYETDKLDLGKKSMTLTKKIPDASGLVKKTNYNVKNTEIEVKIPSITGLAATAALTAVENKIPDVSNLAKKTDYDAKISNIESKCFTTAHYNKFASQTLDAKIKKGISW